ncbi:response regulator [Parafilimonas terrae]|uniref:Response regulator receiver domain-containing protein n=1 Tax=Parafilimonas terrae TaxID=1465490 RepID=A0A1I5X992_9BACT|nr:response regulator [Parafilimonas terrae]SFQ28542.1 Response regulator receiver domain-containing protein [Parafilimonas terrae]
MKKVLLIDDDEEDQEFFIEQLLEYKSSLQVISAYDGEEGLKLIHSIKPKWVFLDVNLPRINGLKLLESIKEFLQAENISVYMYSTNAGLQNKKQASELGAKHYFQKPESIPELRSIFKKAFGE